MKPPEGMKEQRVPFPDLQGKSVADAMQAIYEAAQGLDHPRIERDWDDHMIYGFVPKSEKELAADERRKERAAAKALERRQLLEQDQRAELQRLADRFGLKLVENADLLRVARTGEETP